MQLFIFEYPYLFQLKQKRSAIGQQIVKGRSNCDSFPSAMKNLNHIHCEQWQYGW